jgi:hypothetical protein
MAWRRRGCLATQSALLQGPALTVLLLRRTQRRRETQHCSLVLMLECGSNRSCGPTFGPNGRPSRPALEFRKLDELRICLGSTFDATQASQEIIPLLANMDIE